MRVRIQRYRHVKSTSYEDYEIGCVILQAPFFFERRDWLPIPQWQRNIVRGKTYDLSVEPGRKLWEDIRLRLTMRDYRAEGLPEKVAEESARYGEAIPVRPRFGQAAFRILVTDAYRRQCAVTGEKALPVLEARAHSALC
jgi:putative restriction endonuclease